MARLGRKEIKNAQANQVSRLWVVRNLDTKETPS